MFKNRYIQRAIFFSKSLHTYGDDVVAGTLHTNDSDFVPESFHSNGAAKLSIAIGKLQSNE